MDFTLLQLVLSFAYSIALGFLLGVVYEPVRIFHMCGFNKNHHYFISDVFFMIFSSIITYFYCLVTLEGKIRMFVIAGEIIGFFLYFCLIAPFTRKIFTPIIKLCGKILSNLLKKCRQLMYNIEDRLSCLFSFIKTAYKKLSRRVNKRVENNEKNRYRTDGRDEKKFSKRNKRSKAQKEKTQ